MDETQLARVHRIDVRTIWKDEARNFTPWLAREENLVQLADAIGRPLDTPEIERAVGPFSADIVCNGGDAIIENQLETTDHDHFGKLLTYAAHFDASVAIWVAPEFREQHRAAIDWLNTRSPSDTIFLGVAIEVLRIGKSPPGAGFNVVSGPREWKPKDSPDLSDVQRMQLSFWQDFRAYVRRNGDVIRDTNKPQPSAFLGVGGVGRTGFQLLAVASTWSERGKGHHELRAELNTWNSTAAQSFAQLSSQREDIEQKLEVAPTWDEAENRERCRVFYREDTDISDPDRRTRQYRWLLEHLEALHRAFAPRIKTLD